MDTKFHALAGGERTTNTRYAGIGKRSRPSAKNQTSFKVGLSYNSILDDSDDEPLANSDPYYTDAGDSIYTVSSHIGENSLRFGSNESTNITDTRESIGVPSAKKKRKKISVRKTQNAPSRDSSNDCLQTSILPDSFRSIFKFSYFNKMQTKAFPAIFESDNNCVISSPTGSGKTVLFELAILRLIKKYPHDLANLKILYIAPTKSLCSERLKAWEKTFASLTVGMLTSDTTYFDTDKVKRSNIIITTPEKWDLWTRKWEDYARLFELVRAVLIDEVHTIKERRGTALEVVVTRMNYMCENIRILAVSATIPNVDDIASWLRQKASPARVLYFDDSYRQVALKQYVYGYTFNCKNEFQKDSMYNSKLLEVLHTHSKNKPTLIFCPTRASSVSTAKYLLEYLSLPLSSTISARVNDQSLQECLQAGIAYHHAGLSLGDRTTIENLFLNNQIRILCSTTTLAVGVNLPAYLVIIKGTRIWGFSTSEEYSPLDILQMAGRAGRPQFEIEGCAVILTDSSMKERYEFLVNGTETLESSLHLDFTEHLAAEISLGTVNSAETAVEWLHNTFFYVRFMANPRYYSELQKFIDLSKNKELQLTGFCRNLLQKLSQSQVLETQNGKMFCTPYGHAMTRHYILFSTMQTLINAPKGNTIADLLQLLSNAHEFEELRMRRNEKRLYKEINLSPQIRYPFLAQNMKSQIIDSRVQKVSLLIQHEFGCGEYPTYNGAYKAHQSFLQDKNTIFRHCHRILRCMVDVFITKRDGISLMNALLLLRCFAGNCWEDSNMVLRQLKSIGIMSVKKFSKHHIQSLSDLDNLSTDQIEYYLGLKPGNGAKIKGDYEQLPKFGVQIKLTGACEISNAVTVYLLIEISAVFKQPTWHGKFITVDITTVNSDGELVDFRRIKLSSLRAPKSFSLECSFQKTNSTVVCQVSCQDVAGICQHSVFEATRLDPKYLKKLERSSCSGSALKNCLEGIVDDDSLQEQLSSDDSLYHYLTNKAPIDSTQAAISKSTNAVTRNMLSNGNYECHHTCKAKNRCRHLCCKEGIPEGTLRTNTVAKNHLQKPVSLVDSNKKISILEQLSRSNTPKKKKQAGLSNDPNSSMLKKFAFDPNNSLTTSAKKPLLFVESSASPVKEQNLESRVLPQENHSVRYETSLSDIENLENDLDFLGSDIEF